MPGWNVIRANAYTPFAKTRKGSVAAGAEGKRLYTRRSSSSLWITCQFQLDQLKDLQFGTGMQ